MDEKLIILKIEVYFGTKIQIALYQLLHKL